MAAASFAATSEALLVGARFGLRPEDPHVLRRRFGVGFAMRLMVKDIALAIRHWEEGNATELPLLE